MGILSRILAIVSIYTRVLYMYFDKFLLAVDSCDVSQADKSIIRKKMLVGNFSEIQVFLQGQPLGIDTK
jgi:hypothetical protein